MPGKNIPMKAMIFAAGPGSRLQPLTGSTPKALIPVNGKPMLLHIAEKLAAAGVTDIVVNVHHHARLMKSTIKQLSIPHTRFYVSDESGTLLNTGGGLKKVAGLLGGCGPFFLHNADVLSDIDLRAMLEYHHTHRPLATLAVTKRQSPKYLLWHNHHLTGWTNERTGERVISKTQPPGHMEKMAFSGIHVVEPKIFKLICEDGPFSIIQLYLRLAKNHAILAYEHDPAYWADIGTPEKLQRAKEMVKENPEKFTCSIKR